MSVSGGAQSGKQNGYQSGNMSGVQDSQTNTTQNQTGTSNTTGYQNGQTTGTQTGTQYGSQTGTQYGSQTGTTTANPTAGFGSVSDLLQGLISGNSGMTPQQLAAMGINTNAAQNYGNALDYGGQVMSQYVGDNHQAHTIADPNYVVSPTASTYVDAYQNPWLSQVVDSTRNDLTQGYKQGLTELQAKYGGAMGNGREGVAAGQLADDYTRTLGSTLGNLRSEGYKTALTPAMADSSQQYQANVQNVGNQQQANMFNANQQNVNDQFSTQSIRDWVSNLGAKYGAQTGAANTNAAISQGGIGNLGNFLGSQVPAFGQSNTGTSAGVNTGTSAGTSTGTSSGTSNTTSGSNTETTLESVLNSIMHGTSSGQSSGTSSGSSSSKGGGASVPFF